MSLLLAAEAGSSYSFLSDLNIWSVIVFAIVIAILYRFGREPFGTALQNREDNIAQQLSQAEKAIAEAKKLQAEQEVKRKEVEKEGEALLEEAKRDAESAKQRLKEQAEEEAERIKKRVEVDIDLARKKAAAELWQSTANLSVQLASKIVAQQLTSDDHRRLIDQAIDEIRNSSEGLV